MIKVTDKLINVNDAFTLLNRDNAGSNVIHVGQVKSNPPGMPPSKGLKIEAEGDMEGELRQIEADLRREFKIIDVVLIRRVGELGLGDFILVAAVSANERGDAFAACREAVERYKKMSTVRKNEIPA